MVIPQQLQQLIAQRAAERVGPSADTLQAASDKFAGAGSAFGGGLVRASRMLAERAQAQRAAMLQTPAGAAANQAARAALQPVGNSAQRSNVDLNGNTPGVTTTSDRFLGAAEAATASQQPQVQPNIDTKTPYNQNAGYLSAQNQNRTPTGNQQVVQLLKSIYSTRKLF